jgi:acetyltransferase-like isoleucine patch superfamily enzyme
LLVIRDHRPFALKKAFRRWEAFYVRHFLAPQFDHLGQGYIFMKPWHVEIFGSPIQIGRCVNVIASPDSKVRLSVWSNRENEGRITIGDYCLICPGVRVGSAAGIFIGDNTMLANGAYLTDSDWHDLYNRIQPSPSSKPIIIEDNAWIGDGATVCKGVAIGRNSIVGARAVVVADVPANTIVAGNPARIVKHLDPDRPVTTRASWFKHPEKLFREIDALDREMLRGNTLVGWLRHCLFPAPGD